MVELSLHASHRHRMAESGGGMRVDGDLGDLSGGQFVSALHFERSGAGLDLQAASQRRGNQSCRDFLMNLDDALAEQVFDQVEDGAGVTLQKAADGSKFPVDVDFRPADRKFAALGVGIVLWVLLLPS